MLALSFDRTSERKEEEKGKRTIGEIIKETYRFVYSFVLQLVC